MTDLTALAARLEAATGPSRALDCDITELFEVCEPPDCLPDIRAINLAKVRAGGDDCEIERYTSSLDAITALVERTLPGWTWGLNGADPELDSVCVSELWRGDPNHAPMQRAYAESATPALALCLALVRAIFAQEETK